MSANPTAGAATHADGRPRGLISGVSLTLRPVLEADLPRLALLMSEQEPTSKREPVTLQTLKKRYEDEKKPGLWSDEKKTYAAVNAAGLLLGFVSEAVNDYLHMYSVAYHIAERAADREGLGHELLSLHMELLRNWHRPWRIASKTLEEDSLKRSWLEAAGFELQHEAQRSYWHMGRAVTICHYAWLSAELKAMPAWSEGEPDYEVRG